MLEVVCAAGSIAKAADGDPVRQSQYSRQIKELEDFRVKLAQRSWRGMQLTANGKELAYFHLSDGAFQFSTRLPGRRPDVSNRRECDVLRRDF